jgi:uncharacterized protein (TIGR02757 family)
MLSPSRVAALRPALDRLYDDFNRPDSAADPVQFVWRYDRPADREIVAFLASALAFGNVTSIIRTLEGLLARLGPHPAEYVRAFDPRREADALSGFVHRWTRGEDVVALLLVLRQMLQHAGSLEAFFAAGDDPGHADVGAALESFSTRACAVDVGPAYGARRPRVGVRYFFARPSCGGACKRLNLFLRWMVRQDRLDPGGWTSIPRARLVVPLDVHVIRVGRCLGLTRYRSAGWRMATDVTASLRQIDPVDPIRYDFALCHLGMQDRCGFNRRQADSACPLRGLCRPRARRRPSSRRPSARR